MSDEVIRIGLIGAGANTRLRHIPGFQAIEGVEIVAVSNRTRESGERVAREYGIPKVYDHWDDLLRDPDIDAVCIGTWPYMHCTLVLEALAHDKHVLTEARMAMNAQEAHTMLAAARRKPKLVTQIVPAPHTMKIDRTLKDLIAEGYLGQVLAVDMTIHTGGFIDYDAPLHWRHDRDLSGFNTMLMGIWYEAMMRWLGPAEAVTAVTRVYVRSRRDQGGDLRYITIPDHVEIICELASGPVAHMRFTTVTGLAPDDAVWLFGSEGTIKIDVPSMALYGGRRGDEALQEIPIPPEKEGGWRVEEEFINAIRGKERVTHTSFEDGVKYMEFTEAVIRSAQQGRRIPLPL